MHTKILVGFVIHGFGPFSLENLFVAKILQIHPHFDVQCFLICFLTGLMVSVLVVSRPEWLQNVSGKISERLEFACNNGSC